MELISVCCLPLTMWQHHLHSIWITQTTVVVCSQLKAACSTRVQSWFCTWSSRGKTGWLWCNRDLWYRAVGEEMNADLSYKNQETSINLVLGRVRKKPEKVVLYPVHGWLVAVFVTECFRCWSSHRLAGKQGRTLENKSTKNYCSARRPWPKKSWSVNCSWPGRVAFSGSSTSCLACLLAHMDVCCWYGVPGWATPLCPSAGAVGIPSSCTTTTHFHGKLYHEFAPTEHRFT